MLPLPTVPWRTGPFIRLTIPLIAGIYLASLWAYDPKISEILLLLSGVSVLAVGPLQLRTTFGRSLFGVFLTLFLVCFGYWRCTKEYPLNDNHHFSAENTLDSLWWGRVTLLEPGNRWNRVWYRPAYRLSNQEQLSGQFLVYLPIDSSADIQVGDGLLIRGIPQRIRGPMNPGEPDFAAIYHFKGVHYQLFIRDSANWKRFPAHQWRLRDRAEAYRQWALRRLDCSLSEESFAVMAALMLGWKRALSSEVRSLYIDTGAMHVLAVSGLHVGLVAGAIQWILGLLLPGANGRRYIRLLVALLAIWSFALLTGLAPSVCRASLMFSLWLIGQASGKRTFVFNSLAAAAFVLLVYQPFLLFQLSFQLSFSAVLGILFFQAPLTGLYKGNSQLLRKLWELTAVGLAAQLATLPLTLFYFQQFPIYFWLSGAPIVLNAGLLLGGGTLLILMRDAPILGGFCGDLLEVVIDIQHQFLGWIQQLPHAIYEDLMLSGTQAFLLALGIIGLGLGKGRIWSWYPFLLAVAGVLFLHYRYLQQHRNQDEFHVIHQRKQTELVWSYAGQEVHFWLPTDATTLQWEEHQLVRANAGGLICAGKWLVLIALPDVLNRYHAGICPDVLVVNRGSPWRPGPLLDSFPPKYVVIDGTCPFRKRKQWERVCKERQVPCYYSGRAGAAIFSHTALAVPTLRPYQSSANQFEDQ